VHEDKGGADVQRKGGDELPHLSTHWFWPDRVKTSCGKNCPGSITSSSRMSSRSTAWIQENSS
jgi:hypothetical protein